MPKYILFFLLTSFMFSYAQTADSLDQLVLRNGQIFPGKVDKLKPASVEFREAETGLIYEILKSDIRYLKLTTGKVLTFEESQADPPKKETREPVQYSQQPVIIEKDESAPVGLVVLASVGVVLLVLLLIGAAAQ